MEGFPTPKKERSDHKLPECTEQDLDTNVAGCTNKVGRESWNFDFLLWSFREGTVFRLGIELEVCTDMKRK